MHMRKSTLSLTLLALVAGTAATALAQGVPTTQPKFLHIFREQIKPGRSAEHAKWEAGWPAAYEKAKSPVQLHRAPVGDRPDRGLVRRRRSPSRPPTAR